MRIRTIKPEFWTHRMHARLSEAASLLGAALLNFADDEGRFEANEGTITSNLFPRRPLSKPVGDCLAELAGVRWIVLYDGEVDGERLRLGQIVKFKRHQVINKPRLSSLPSAPADVLREYYGSDTVALPPPRKEHYQQSESRATASEHSPETVALPPSQEGKERKEGREGGTHALALAPSERDFPEPEWPTESAVLTECEMKGIPAALGSKFWRHYESKSPRWKEVGNWRLKLWDWHVRDTEQNGRQKTGPGAGPMPAGELRDICAELQWQTEPARIEFLKKRRRELEELR